MAGRGWRLRLQQNVRLDKKILLKKEEFQKCFGKENGNGHILSYKTWRS